MLVWCCVCAGIFGFRLVGGWADFLVGVFVWLLDCGRDCEVSDLVVLVWVFWVCPLCLVVF